MDNNSPLQDRVALVTGGSRGIGAAVVVRLAELGADVAFTYLGREDRAAEVVDRVKDVGRRAVALRADAVSADAVRRAVADTVGTFGRLDVLVNNAAAYPVGPVEDVTDVELDRTLAANVRAPYVAVQAALPHLPEGGRVITIGSNVSRSLPFPGLTLYALTKSALVGMTKGLARDLGPRGITAVLVNPGPTDTDLNPADGPMSDTIRGLTALGRYVAPDDVADTVAFLAGPGGRSITGTTVEVDAGITA